MLVGMALLVLLMPMSYRAGTETAHPHAFFQDLIDLATGTPHEHGSHVGASHEHGAGDAQHHHDAGTTPAPVATLSPFLAADIPLAAAVEVSSASRPVPTASLPFRSVKDSGQPTTGAVAADASRDVVVASLSPDLPGMTDVTPAAEKASAILVLATLLAGILLDGWRRRDLWTTGTRLFAVATRVEAPPPRLTPC